MKIAMSIRRRLFLVTAGLVFALAGPWLFSIITFSKIAATYRGLAGIQVPQLEVAAIMNVCLASAEADMGDLLAAESSEEYSKGKEALRGRLRDFAFLEDALRHGHANLGERIIGLEGFKISSCAPGGHLEALLTDISASCSTFQGLCTVLMDKKQEKLHLLVDLSGEGINGGGGGVANVLRDSLQGLGPALVQEQNGTLKFLYADLRRVEERIAHDPAPRRLPNLRGFAKPWRG